jgi:hypothetical protein
MRYRLYLSVFLSLLFCVQQTLAIDYGQLMAKKVKEVLGSRSNGYTFSTYPVDNFGLATAYEDRLSPSSELCATWDCLGVHDDSQVARMSSADRLKLKVSSVQYADTGDGPELKLSDEEKNALGLKALLPKLAQVLHLSLDLSHSKNLVTSVMLGPVTIRTLRRKEMLDHLRGKDAHPLERAAFEKRALILVYSDIVVSSMRIDLKVDATTDVEIDAALQESLHGKLRQIIGKDSGLSFKVNRADKGDYSFQINRPVILAVYTRRQPKAGELGSEQGWSGWPIADVKNTNKVLAEKIDLGDVD